MMEISLACARVIIAVNLDKCDEFEIYFREKPNRIGHEKFERERGVEDDWSVRGWWRVVIFPEFRPLKQEQTLGWIRLAGG